jgi:hypothetical protein
MIEFFNDAGYFEYICFKQAKLTNTDVIFALAGL